MKTVKLSITPKIIEKASRKDSKHCIIADALTQRHPDAKWVSVDMQSVRFTVNGKRFKYFTPPEAQQALIRFDRGEVIKPFNLKLTEGITIDAGWAAQRPKGRKRNGKVVSYKRRKETKPRKKRLFPQREREFGLRKLK